MQHRFQSLGGLRLLGGDGWRRDEAGNEKDHDVLNCVHGISLEQRDETVKESVELTGQWLSPKRRTTQVLRR